MGLLPLSNWAFLTHFPADFPVNLWSQKIDFLPKKRNSEKRFSEKKRFLEICSQKKLSR